MAAMTREQAIETAERFTAAEGLSVGPVFEARFSDGSEFIDCTPPSPYWMVYFKYNGPPWEELPEERKGILSHGWNDPTIIIVDDATGRAESLWTL
jgi:hypothetical protein